MNTIVIILLVIGLCMIIVSCILVGRSESAGQQVSLNDYELNEEAMANLQENIKSAIKEYSDQLVEDTNRQLTALSNKSMMEISELADQVLADIEKNHKECVFLYDMLEDKGQKLKAYVSNSAEQLLAMEEEEQLKDTMQDLAESEEETVSDELNSANQIKEYMVEQIKQQMTQEVYEEDMEGTEEVQQRNQQILSMYRDGMQPIEIAKTLDLGVGEVKLIVDLFQGER